LTKPQSTVAAAAPDAGGPRFDVFLSHASADKPLVEELARRLVAAGIVPWLDRWNLVPGTPWQSAIEDALEVCDACAVFVGAGGVGPWQNEEFRAAVDRRVRAGAGRYRVIPVLLPGAERDERSRLPAFLAATTWVEFRRGLDDEDALHRLISGIRGVAPGPGPEKDVYAGICPYRGLESFDVADAPFFFGREALVEWLVNALRPRGQEEPRFLAIVGPSGSGKSSLVRAGLLASLRAGALDGSGQWPMAVFRPGADPLESLAVALCDVLGEDNAVATVRGLIDELRADPRALHVAVRVALRNVDPGCRLVVLGDQFEEVFTHCGDDVSRRALIDNLLYAATVARGKTVVLLTLRADFYGRCAPYPELAAALSDHQLLVGPMSDDEVRAAIERPALLTGIELEPGLADTLVDDVRGQAGALPLLQHALLELWNRRSGRVLTHDAYRAIGGLTGALEQRAEAVFADFDEAERRVCRQLFLRLTQPGEGTEDTKRRASLQELLSVDEGQETLERVIRALAGEQARLITTEGGASLSSEQYVEVAHEALIGGWSRLRHWIEQDPPRFACTANSLTRPSSGDASATTRDSSTGARAFPP
jgi:hypothetical protein